MLNLTTDTREAGAYRWRDENLDILHTSSVPRTDQEAFEYARKVEAWLPGHRVTYIERRELNEGAFALMDIQIIEGKVVPL